LFLFDKALQNKYESLFSFFFTIKLKKILIFVHTMFFKIFYTTIILQYTNTPVTCNNGVHEFTIGYNHRQRLKGACGAYPSQKYSKASHKKINSGFLSPISNLSI